MELTYKRNSHLQQQKAQALTVISTRSSTYLDLAQMGFAAEVLHTASSQADVSEACFKLKNTYTQCKGSASSPH